MGDTENRYIPAEAEIKARLEQTLVRHLETGQEFDELSINLPALSSIVLLSEREREVESGSCGSMDRYTEDTLLGALSDMGIKPNGGEKGMIAALAENTYIEIGPNGRLFAKEHLTAFMKTLNRSFPTMQGLNLVAYIVQTMDEVISGRKALEFAVEQFDQTLQLRKKAVNPSAEGTDIPNRETKKTHAPMGDKKLPGSLKNALSRRLRNRKTRNVASGKQHSRESLVVSSTGAVKPLDIHELSPGKAEAEKAGQPSSELERAEAGSGQADPIAETVLETDTERCRDDEAQSIEDTAGHGSTVLVGEEADTEPVADPLPGADTEPPPDPESSLETAPSDDNDVNRVIPEARTGKISPRTSFDETYRDKYESRGSDKDENSLHAILPDLMATSALDGPEIESVAERSEENGPSDKAVEERIASFYQSLAMTCPVCRSSSIREQKTEKGKSFFTCSDSKCVFVSWSKPYLMNCPWCKNPFLVEGIGKNGGPALKCPRATCHYQQAVPDDHPADASACIMPPHGPKPDSSAGRVRKPVRKAKRVVRRRVIRKKR